jgi:hypothetical protein
MIIFGSQSKAAVVANADEQFCKYCSGPRPFSVYLRYTVRHLYYLLRFVTGKTYTMACATCGEGETIDAKQFEATLEKSPISWFDRFGWTIAVGLLAFGVLAIILSSRQNDADNASFIAAPRAGDLYVLDLAQGVTNPERPQMYTLGRVTQVAGGNVTIELGRRYYNLESGVRDDIRERNYANPGYFGTDAETMPAAQLRTLQRDGALIDIDRQ